jgi:hypothetical protein
MFMGNYFLLTRTRSKLTRLAVLNFRFELQKARPTAHRMSSSAALVQGDTHAETHDMSAIVSKSPVS